MNITIKSRIVERLRSDVALFQQIETTWDPDKKKRSYDDADVDLSRLTRSECERLRDVLQTSGIQGTRVLAADVTKYLRAAQDGVATMRARTVRQAAWILEFFVAQLPHHALFSRDDAEAGSHLGYYVEDVDYRPDYKHGGRHDPERVELTLWWVDLDERKSETVSIYAEAAIDRLPAEILAGLGYVAETPALWDKLAAETARYYEVRDQVGAKYLARGLGRADLDDAAEGGDARVRSLHVRGSKKMIRMDPFGRPQPVVVDVLSETGEGEDERLRGRRSQVRLYRWHPQNLRFHAPSEEALARYLEADEDTEFAPALELPVHPLVPCFDLARHVRARVHVNNLIAYAYHTEVAGGLVIPAADRALVDLLVDQSQNDFQDVVAGKGQSMNVLSVGPPGTGKTLTAEVFAEFKHRPLFTVQCSQLGVDPQAIEQSLRLAIQRANRWNAILLLDEADVYIRRREHDLVQNAIVGAFLRVLEYAQCILFMTTNLADQIDDAIASRCIVRLHYDLPSPADQRRIWAHLAALNDLALPPGVVDGFVEDHPRISGRDVKNLLKLASLIAHREGGAITRDVLDRALRYKPTISLDEDARR